MKNTDIIITNCALIKQKKVSFVLLVPFFLLFAIDLIHDGHHVGFPIIMQISYTLLRGQTTQVGEMTTQMTYLMTYLTFIEYLSSK